MIELLLTSFPVIWRYWYLKKNGMHINVWNMHVAVFAWFVLAAVLFVTIFYFHPKSVSGLVPFKVAAVVPQTGGPVTEVFVENGQEVKQGDLLFTIENSRQLIAVMQSQSKIQELSAAVKREEIKIIAVENKVSSAQTSLKQAEDELERKRAIEKKNKNVVSAREIERLINQRDIRVANLGAAKAELQAAQVNLNDVLTAQLNSAKISLENAENELYKTEVRSLIDGTVTQVALTKNAPATQLVSNPSMLIIPNRKQGERVRIIAGFNQVANNVIHPGMAAEVACEANSSLSMSNMVLPARLVYIQDAVAAGQVRSSGSLIEPRSRAVRGSVLASFELIHPEHDDLILNGSGCIVQTYSSELHGFGGHVIGAMGAVKAIVFRMKVWAALIVGTGLTGAK